MIKGAMALALASLVAFSKPTENVRYGLLKLTLFPEDAEVGLSPVPNNRSQIASSGKLGEPKKYVLPLGRHTLHLAHPDYQEKTLNIVLSLEKPFLEEAVSLVPKPFDLVLSNAEPGTDLYLNDEHLLTLRQGNVVLPELPGGQHQLLLSKGNAWFERRFNSLGRSEVVVDRPNLLSPNTKAAMVGGLGLLPGMNCVLHLPRHSLGLMLPMGVLFYTSVAGHFLGRSETITWLSENSGRISPSFFGWTMAISAVLHAGLAYADFLGYSRRRLQGLGQARLPRRR